MPLSDSMEKLPTADHTAGPIAVFSNSYARLPEHFYARLSPTPVAKPRLIIFNESLASELGVDTRGLEPEELAAVFAGNVIPPGAEPIAMAYAGHQFGNFVPQLGDGRAILLGEVVDRNGERRDIQLKGVRALFANPAAYDSWVARWRSRLAVEKLEPDARAQAMRSVNPAFIPRNHCVEQALGAAIEYGDFSPFSELLRVLSQPYKDQAVFADYAHPPHANERVLRTFCGT
jgi:uncharacterized protein YdiU (UPF0061 family)